MKKRVGLSMAVIITAVFMSILDTSIVNVAIPKMMAVFSASTTQIQWVITAYTLVVGTLVPVTAYLGDRFGYKRIFVYALAVFTIGSGLCGLAWSNSTMIAFRILQALGGGALLPVSMAMSFRMFPPEKRGMAMGIFGIAIMFAPALGPTLSGYLTEYVDWRLIFYINVPIGIVDWLLAMLVLEEYEHSVKQRFDVWGFITSTVGFSTLLYGLGIVPDKGWGDPEVAAFILIACISLLAFVVIELNVKDPMLDLRLLKNQVYSFSLVISSLVSIVMFGGLFLIPVFLQTVAGLSAIQTGLLLLPQALITGVMMPISGALFDRIGAKWLTVVGLLIMSYSQYLCHFLDVNTPYTTLAGWMMMRGIGIGMCMMPITAAGMNTIPNEKQGQGSAITNAARQVSASFGVAWLTVLFYNRIVYHAAIGAEQVDVTSYAANQLLSTVGAMVSASGMPDGDSKSVALAYVWGQLQTYAMVQAIDDVFWVTIWLALAGAGITLFLKEVRTPGKTSTPMLGE